MLATTPPLHDRAENTEKVLSDTVKRTVRDHLKGGEIVSVRSGRGEDFDGDEVITVTVVVNASPSDFEPQRLASLIGKLRTTLAEIDEYAFPMVSFVSPAENMARVQ